MPFLPLMLTVIALAAISVGTAAGCPQHIYSSPGMTTLWGATCISAIVILVCRRRLLNTSSVIIHLSLLLIISGAFVSHITSREGEIHLRLGEKPSSKAIADGKDFHLPFKLALSGCHTVTYPATSTPMDYAATIRSVPTSDIAGNHTLRMNKTANVGNWKLTLNSFDSDSSGVTLRLRSDFPGTLVSFTAYALLGIGMILYFFYPNTVFRNAWRKVAGSGVPVILFTLLPGQLQARDSLSSDFIGNFGAMQVLHNGRIAPVATLASDFTSTITAGASSALGYSAEEILTGYLFNIADWKDRRIVKIKNPKTRSLLGITGSNASYTDFMQAVASGKIILDDPLSTTPIADDLSRFEAISQLLAGRTLRIFPYRSPEGKIEWLSPADKLPREMDSDQWIFIHKSMSLINEMVAASRFREAEEIIRGIRKYQVKISGHEISDTILATERIYNDWGSGRWLAIITLLTGIAAFVTAMSPRRRSLPGIIYFLLPLSLLILSSLIIIRWIISGHLPLANGFETMQFLAWILLAIGTVSGRRLTILTPLTLIGAGGALMVASMSGAATSVSPLMPVLSSPLLSLHVVCVMLAYALLFIIALCGAMALIKGGGCPAELLPLSRIMLYPAIFLLAAGIFIGAVWADMSWGIYWSWDPKETWALITMLIYSLPMHPAILPVFGKPRAYHIYVMAAFLSVLITYFGVNFFLGGLHSYA